LRQLSLQRGRRVGRVLADIVSEHRELARDAPATPERIFGRHALDQRDDLGG